MAKISEPAENQKEPNEEMSSPAGMTGLFAFTIDASTGQVAKLEKVDSAGARRQLSEQDKASLQASAACPTLEAIIEQAFEAGLDCVLGNEDEKDEVRESEDEAETRRILLLPLMERSRMAALLQRSVLGQAILATAMRQVFAPHASTAEGSPAQPKIGAVVKPHQSGAAGPAQH
jgi:hypothetical protein